VTGHDDGIDLLAADLADGLCQRLDRVERCDA